MINVDIKSRLIMCILTLAISFFPALGKADTDCFKVADNQTLKYDVFQFANPPRSGRTGDYPQYSPFYPATDYITASVKMLNETATRPISDSWFRKHYMLWANRCTYLIGVTPDNPDACRNMKRTKGNLYPRMSLGPLKAQLRTHFSTYEKANSCTLLSARSVLGEPYAAIKNAASAVGLNLVLDTAEPTDLSRMSSSVRAGADGQVINSLVDTCVVSSEKISSDVTGVVLDYEVFDERTPSETLSFLTALKAVLSNHNKSLILTTNPLPRPQNGIDTTNVRDIVDLADAIGFTIWSGATPGNADIQLKPKNRKFRPLDSYRLQVGVLTDNGRVPLSKSQRKKILWNISLFDTEISEAQQLRAEILQNNYRGIMIFRNYQRQGGSCVKPANQVTACIALGRCDNHFRGSE
jgi:hypothetical protein